MAVRDRLDDPDAVHIVGRLLQPDDPVLDAGADDDMWEDPHGMSERGLGAILPALLILASCGGGGDSAPRVTLTDKSCTYSGARTHEPGVFDIEAENTTSHSASFAVFELEPGFSIKDVRGFFQRLMVAHDRGDEVKPPTPSDFRRNEAWSQAAPRATTHLPVNGSAGRFVIVCLENPSARSQVHPFPAAAYVPIQLEIR